MKIKKKLAIFDLDGTLFDTSEVNYLSYSEACRRLGYNLNREMFLASFVGKNYKEFLPICGVENIEDIEKIHEIKKNIYVDFLGSAKINVHLFELIITLKNDYIIALATTASKKNTYEILSKFDVRKEFDFILTQDDTSELKPNPECYLKTMDVAGIDPEHTIIFEDSEVGLQAAYRSGGYPIKISI